MKPINNWPRIDNLQWQRESRHQMVSRIKEKQLVQELCTECYLHQWVRYASYVGFVKHLSDPDKPTYIGTSILLWLILDPCYCPWNQWLNTTYSIGLNAELVGFWKHPVIVLPEEEQAMWALASLGK